MKSYNGLPKGMSASSLRTKVFHPLTPRTLDVGSRWVESRDLERPDTAQTSNRLGNFSESDSCRVIFHNFPFMSR